MPNRAWKTVLLLWSICSGLTCRSQETTNTVSPITNQTPSAAARHSVKEISPGIFQIGDVKINKHQRSVSFPAVVNLRHGAMEYFLVSSWGKVHESILRTESEPYRIHLGMLLLGAKGAATNEEELAQPPAPFVSQPSEFRVPGDKINVEVRWRVNGKETRRRAEELVYNTQKKSKLNQGYWVYNGSFMDENTFLAQREGSAISLVTDPEALINYTGPGHDNDTVWIANTNRLPRLDVPLEVVIQLPKSKQKR